MRNWLNRWADVLCKIKRNPYGGPSSTMPPCPWEVNTGAPECCRCLWERASWTGDSTNSMRHKCADTRLKVNEWAASWLRHSQALVDPSLPLLSDGQHF